MPSTTATTTAPTTFFSKLLCTNFIQLLNFKKENLKFKNQTINYCECECECKNLDHLQTVILKKIFRFFCLEPDPVALCDRVFIWNNRSQKTHDAKKTYRDNNNFKIYHTDSM